METLVYTRKENRQMLRIVVSNKKLALMISSRVKVYKDRIIKTRANGPNEEYYIDHDINDGSSVRSQLCKCSTV